MQAQATFRVLMAEDEELIRDIIGHTLQEIDYLNIDIDFVENGLEAFKKLYSNSYDLFITDFGMPKIDGESLIEMWRLKVFPHHCPTLLAITGDIDTLNSLTLNDDSLYTLTKPFDVKHLEKKLKLILGTIKLQRDNKDALKINEQAS